MEWLHWTWLESSSDILDGGIFYERRVGLSLRVGLVIFLFFFLTEPESLSPRDGFRIFTYLLEDFITFYSSKKRKFKINLV